MYRVCKSAPKEAKMKVLTNFTYQSVCSKHVYDLYRLYLLQNSSLVSGEFDWGLNLGLLEWRIK